jgi:hypothetical protein
MKYLEQRVEELEKEVNLLKAKNKLNDTSSYLNNYPPYNNPNSPDYMYNDPSLTLLSEPDFETSFASPWDSSDTEKQPLNTITLKTSSIVDDTIISDILNNIDAFEYPNIIGSWDDKPFNDVINENVTDEYGFKMNDDVITSWGFESEFDKQDKDFLKYLNSTEKKIEKDFGKIISKFKILTHEWEMDGYGYIVRDLEYNKNAIVTNHGKPMVVNKSYLNDIISGYKERIQETQRALFLINE